MNHDSVPSDKPPSHPLRNNACHGRRRWVCGAQLGWQGHQVRWGHGWHTEVLQPLPPQGGRRPLERARPSVHARAQVCTSGRIGLVRVYYFNILPPCSSLLMLLHRRHHPAAKVLPQCRPVLPPCLLHSLSLPLQPPSRTPSITPSLPTYYPPCLPPFIPARSLHPCLPPATPPALPSSLPPSLHPFLSGEGLLFIPASISSSLPSSLSPSLHLCPPPPPFKPASLFQECVHVCVSLLRP